MIVYRLCREQYASDLSGKGAEIFGGRWNSKGNAALYTASSRALAMVEVAVHLSYQRIPKDMKMVVIEVPDTRMEIIQAVTLLDQWNEPYFSTETQNLGDQFLNLGKNLLIKVPAAVVSGDFNYIINPRHHSIMEVSVISLEPFLFDKLLLPGYE